MVLKKKSEKDYRKLELDSSSSLKMFSVDRRKYEKLYIRKEKVEEEDSKASIVGRVVETLLLEPEEFENRFHMSTVVSLPTGLMLEFVNSLHKQTIEYTNEEGDLVKDFAEMCKDAYTEAGFKIKLEAVLNKFVGSDAEIYYKELVEVSKKGLTVVTLQDVTNAENIVKELQTNIATAEIVNQESNAVFEVHNQFQIEGYEVDGMKFKSMMDKIIINHHDKTIQIYDLKCTWNVENFFEEYYLKRRSYIQAYLYHEALLTCDENIFGFNHREYAIVHPAFIVCDSTNYMEPLVYTLTGMDLLDAYEGFEYKGREYRGVRDIIKDLKWAKENDKWRISRENFINNGQINLRK